MNRSHHPLPIIAQQNSIEMIAPPSSPVAEASQSFFGYQVRTMVAEVSTSEEHLGKGGHKSLNKKCLPPSDKALRRVSKGSVRKIHPAGDKRFLDKNQPENSDYFMQAVRDSLGELSEQRGGAGKLELTEMKKVMDDIQ